MLSECVDSAEIRELAARKARQQTRLDASNLARHFARLAVIAKDGEDPDVSANDSEELDGASIGLLIDVQFDDGAEGYPCMHIAIEGDLNLECQRCLRPVRYPVNLEARLTILNSDAEASRIVEPFDSIVMTADGLNLPVIMEDEILSTLPIAPMHGSGTKCARVGNALYKSEIEAGKPNRPFAGLAPLLRAAGKDRDD